MPAYSKLRVASGKHLAYAPQYLAAELGLFAREGVDVSFVTWPVGDTTIVDNLRRGEADLVLGSMLFALRLRDEGLEPAVVAQSNQQTRHWIMGRPDHVGAFDWGCLRGAAVVVYPNPVPTPWVAFHHGLSRKGISLDAIKPIIGYTAEQAVAEFARGVGDYLLIDPESVDPTLGLIELAPVAEALGPVPWSIYCCLSSQLEALSGLEAFRRALSAAVQWLYKRGGEGAADSLAALFPAISRNVLAAQLDRYVRARLWVTDTALQAEQVERWETALQHGGLLAQGMSLRAFCPALAVARE